MSLDYHDSYCHMVTLELTVAKLHKWYDQLKVQSHYSCSRKYTKYDI
jgi:hypothetical protein